MANEDIRFQMGMDVQADSVDQAKQKLKELSREMEQVTKGVKLDVNEQDIEKTKTQISALERSIKEAERSGGSFGNIFEKNMKEITAETKKAASQMNNLDRESKQFGTAGQRGFQSVSKAAKLATADIRGTQTQMDKLRTNMEQGLGQTLAFGAIGAVSGGFISALNVAKDLDKVSTDIRIVSGQTADEMKEYRDAASDASDILGTTTQKYLEASLIYKQQGGEAAYYAKELAESTVVAANISGVATDQMSEYLTSTINGFELLKEKGGEAGTYITDVLAQLGAASGSDLAEVATALTRVAATAKEAGYEFEEISTMIATVSERTRQSPQTIGNAFKSILANFNQLKEAGEDDVNAFTSKVEEAFKSANLDISIFDNGSLRDASDIFDDIADQWDTMSKEQQALVASSVAGKHQMEYFMAFMDSQERYTDLLAGAYESAGTSANQQLVYMDSLQAKTDQLKNAWQEAVDKVVDSDMFKGVLEDLTNMVKLVGSAESGAGGLAVALAPLIGLGGNFFAAPKFAEAYGNKKANNINIDTNAIVESLGLEKAEREKILAQQDKELAKAKEINDVQKNLGENAANRYVEAREEAERLNQVLDNIVVGEDEINKKAKHIAENLGGDSSQLKGFSQARIISDAENIKQNDSDPELQNIREKIELQKQETLIQEQSLAQLKQVEVLRTEDYKKLDSGAQRLYDWYENTQKVAQTSDVVSKNYKNMLDDVYKITEYATDTYLTESDEKKVLDQLNQLKAQILEKQESIEKSQEDTLKNSQQSIASAEKELDIKSKTKAAAAQVRDQSANAPELKAQQEVAAQTASQLENASTKAATLRKGISGLATTYQAVVPLIATYKAAQDGVLSTQDAVTTGTQALSTALISSFTPLGAAAGVAIGAFGLLADHFDLFKEKGEKAKEANEELIKSFLSLQEEVSGNKQNLSSVQEIYESWTGVDVKTFLNNKPDPADEEAVKKYTEQLAQYDEMANKVASTNPEVVEGYDETGRVIIDLSKSFEQLMKVQEKAGTQNYALMNENSESFVSQQVWELNDATEKLNKYSTKITEAKKDLEEAKSAGDNDAVGSALKDLAKAQNKLGEVRKSFTEVKGSIQTNLITPFNEANVSFQELIKKAPELETVFDQFSSSYLNTDSISNLAALGDEDGINNLMKNLSLIRDKYVELGKEDPQKAIDFMKQFTEASEWTKLSLYDTHDALTDLQKSMEKLSDPVQDSYSRVASVADSFISENDATKVKERMSELAEASKEAREEVTKYSKAYDSGYNPASDKIAKNNEKEIDSLNKKIDSYNQLESELYKVTQGYEKTSRTMQGFNENLEKVSGLEKTKNLLKEISKQGIDTGSFKQLSEISPKIAEELQKASDEGPKEFEKASKNMYQALAKEQDAATTGMMLNNEEYFVEWQKENVATVNKASELYGIDAANYTNLNQYKGELEKLSLEDLRIIAGAKVDTTKEGNEEETKSHADKTQKALKLNEIFANDTLTMGEKIHVAWLSIVDSIANALQDSLQGLITGLSSGLNWIHKKIGNALADINRLKSKIPGNKNAKADAKNADEFDSWGEGGPGTTAEDFKTRANSAQKQADAYAKARRDKILAENKEKNALIQDIVDGEKTGSATDMANRLNLLNPKDPNSIAAPIDLPGEKNNETNPDKDKEGKDKKEVENLELELDRYYKLENLLKRVEDRYTELEQAKDAAYGQDKLNLMQQEQNLLQERVGILHNYSNELSKEQAELKNKLVSSGFSFDTNGDIANLNQRLTALQNEANSKAGEAKEEAINNIKKIQEEAKRYTDITFNLIPDKKKALDEIKKQLSDIAKERIEYQIKLQVDKNDLKKQVIDTVKELNDGFANSDERLQLTGQAMKVSLDEVDFYKNKISQIKNDPGLTDSARQELLQDANKSLLSAVANAQSAYKDLGAIQAGYVKELKEAFDVINDRYENILDKSDTLIDKTSELYGNRGYGKIQEYYKVQEEALGDQLAYLVDAQKEMVRYRNTLNQSTDAWKEANNAVNELGEKIESNLLRKLESVRKQFEAFTANLESKFENMFGTWGFQGAQDDFDKLIEKQDKYFNSFEKLSTIGQRIKSINEEIAKTNDPKRAAELTALREKEYDTLLKGEKVSQDDYERAEKLYQIKLKELALEERQNAKRIAQLVRDENGNISYEYVRQETEDMQEELDELQKQKDDLYKFDSDKVRESAQGVFDVISKYQSQLKELQDKGLSPDEYKKELAKLLNDAESDIKDKTTEMNKWLENAGKDGLNSLQNMINNGVVDPDSLGLDKNTMQSIFSAMQDGSLSIQDMLSGDYGDFASSIGTTSDELKSQMDSMLELILGDNFDIAQAMIESSNKWTNTAQTNVNLLGDAYSQYMSQADSVLQQYNNSTGTLNGLLNITNAAANTVISTTKNQTNAMIQAQQQTDKYSFSVNNLTNKLVGANGLYSGMVQVNRTMNENLQPSMVATGNITDVLSNKTNNSANKYRSMAHEATSAYTRVNAFRDEPTKRSMDRIDEITSKSNRSASAFRSINTDASKARQSVLDFSGAVQNLKSYGAYKLDTGGLVSGATGMYTGTWNNSANNADGRLALLHEKEIVLNKSDTQNLLDAVHMQRDLLKSVEGRGDAAGTMVNRMSSNIQNVQNNSTQTVSQPVTIYADFPNVHKSVEIENAFAGMFTQASTYIGKKN